MAISLPTVIPLGSKSRVDHSPVYTGKYEFNYNYNSRNNRGNNYNNVWLRLKQMVRRQYNPYFRYIRRFSRFRFGIYNNNSWFRLYSRSNFKSSQSGTISNRNRKRNRNYFYYSILISLLAIGLPVKAEDEINNTSNPVAAATGNVTNQAVQFQNNGAPSRQHYGPNISCNGSTMTFSPFYMGNHTRPFDEYMDPQSYTLAENWGFQVNLMVPLDQNGLKQCRRIAARQEEKMRLDYELVRVLKCAELQQKGFMLIPGSRVYDMCHDVIAIAKYVKLEKAAEEAKNPQPKPKPWYKPF